MAEREVEAAWRDEFGRIHGAEAPHNSQTVLDGAKAAFRGRVMHLKFNGSRGAQSFQTQDTTGARAIA